MTSEQYEHRIRALEKALNAAGGEISLLLDGCVGPNPVWIQEILSPPCPTPPSSVPH